MRASYYAARPLDPLFVGLAVTHRPLLRPVRRVQSQHKDRHTLDGAGEDLVGEKLRESEKLSWLSLSTGWEMEAVL